MSHTDAREKYLDEVTVGERERLDAPIHLEPYQAAWRLGFARQAERIRRALGEEALLLQHVGSTSVPGLTAKPVIDIVLAVPDSADEASYVPQLEEQGFVLKIREPEWFEHRLLTTPERNVNLHVFSFSCEEIGRMLAFRDWLRANEADRRLYAETKQKLAARTWEHTQQYADAKSDVVRGILERALDAARRR